VAPRRFRYIESVDNVTHTLVGLAVAEAVIQARRTAAADSAVSLSWARTLYVTSALANNVLDVDLLLTPLTGGKLGYLLHHRGHTHTLLGSLPLALATLAVPLAIWRWRAFPWTRRDVGALVAVTFAGTLLHLLLDYGNSYGVHPFWPFDNSWRYGDSLFIVEPWMWLTLAAPLFFATRLPAGRIVLALLMTAALFLLWGTGLVPAVVAGAVTAWWLVMMTAAKWLAPGRRIAAGAAAALVLAGMFVFAGRQVRETVTRDLAAEPDMRTLDVVLTPFPANPLCWSAVAVQRSEDGDRYVLRQGTVAPWPAVLPPADCPKRFSEGGDAPLVRDVAPVAGVPTTIVWHASLDAALPEMRRLAVDHCVVGAFLRFARAPFFVDGVDGRVLLGDLRFDREEGEGFAEITVAGTPPEACPPRVPPWVPPRADAFYP
jgi:inner membrane protein